MSDKLNSLTEKLSELKALREQIPGNIPTNTKIALKENDIFRLEIIMLKSRIAELEVSNSNLLRDNFYSQLVIKYGIDINKNNMTIDPKTNQILLTIKNNE